MSLWKAQTAWIVKDINLWRRVSVTEPQKNTTGSLKELVLLQMWYGLRDLISLCGNATYSSYAVPQAKNRILMEMQENPQTFQQHQVFLCFGCFYFTQQLQFCSLRHSTDLFSSFSTFALINIHEVILEPALLCSVGWLCGDVSLIDKSLEKQKVLMNIQKQHHCCPIRHWLRLTWTCSAGKDECML